MTPNHHTDIERPIRTSTEDALDRGRFISRLCKALINDETQRATGVVIGITGSWGSGKSSVLNMLDEYIHGNYTSPKPAIIRFDPWLLSRHEDLIRHFFDELISCIPDDQKTIKEQLGQYRHHLRPAISIASSMAKLIPGAGGVAEAVEALIEQALPRDSSLHQMRQDLRDKFAEIETPIVVLIDELDRVEDAEVKAVAQLVRSVADFPNVSYVLAYDEDRVIEALGSGDRQRGQAYLEKIVQLQIPLPLTFDAEIRELLLSDMERLVADVGLPDGWRSSPRYSASNF